MAGVMVDDSELREFAADLTKAGAVAAVKARAVVAKGALNIKNQLRDEAEASRHFRMAQSMSYDMEDAGLAAVIGPEKGGAGSLANIAYFGGANGGGGTVPDPRGALEDEVPRFLVALSKIAGEAIQ